MCLLVRTALHTCTTTLFRFQTFFVICLGLEDAAGANVDLGKKTLYSIQYPNGGK